MPVSAGSIALRGLGTLGLAATGAAALLPLQPAAGLALPASAAALLGGAWAARALASRHPLDRPLPAGRALVLGRGRRGTVLASLGRLAGGLCVEGPAATRRAFLADLSRQAATAGIGHALVSCGPGDTLVERARSDGAGLPWTLTVLDADETRHGQTHRLGPFAGLPGEAVARTVVAMAPATFAPDAGGGRARALLRAVSGALCHLQSEGFIDEVTPRMLLDHADLRRVMDLSDGEFYPTMPEGLRRALASYLSGLPAFQAEKKYKQSAATLDAHAVAASALDEALSWTCSPGAPPLVTGVPDVLAASLASPEGRTVLRAAHGPGDERSLRLLVSCLRESLKAAPRPGGAPYLVIVDGIDDIPADVAESLLSLARLGVAVAAGVRDASAPAGARAAAASALRVSLSGEAAAARATLAQGDARIRFRPGLAPPPGTPAPLRRRIPLDPPSRSEFAADLKFPLVLERMLDPGLPVEAELHAADSSATLRSRALDGDAIATVAERMAAVPDEDPVRAACGAIAAFMLATPPEPAAGAFPDRPAEPRALGMGFGPGTDLPLADLDIDGLFEPGPEPAAPRPTAVVVPASCARDPYLADTPWKALGGNPMPLARLGDREAARATLVGEFPHLARIVDRILAEAVRGDHVRLRPILFHGSAGSGKSRFARRLAETLGLKPVSYNCGGASDSSFGGTSRQWQQARPSIPLRHVGRSGLANPAILLDEVEKVGTGRHNGNLADLMLGLTERETAARSFDLYLEAEADLSHVNWLATANSTKSLHQAFRDRFHMVEVPLPGKEHADVLVPAFVAAAERDRGTPAEWAFVPSEAEVAIIAEIWGGGSLRRLRRAVEKTLDAVEGMDRRMMH